MHSLFHSGPPIFLEFHVELEVNLDEIDTLTILYYIAILAERRRITLEHNLLRTSPCEYDPE